MFRKLKSVVVFLKIIVSFVLTRPYIYIYYIYIKLRNHFPALRISPLALLLNCASEDEFLVATESLFQDFRAL